MASSSGESLPSGNGSASDAPSTSGLILGLSRMDLDEPKDPVVSGASATSTGFDYSGADVEGPMMLIPAVIELLPHLHIALASNVVSGDIAPGADSERVRDSLAQLTDRFEKLGKKFGEGHQSFRKDPGKMAESMQAFLRCFKALAPAE